MTSTEGDASVASPEIGDSPWRRRALERSLRDARARAMSRSDRFIETAMELLEETGHTDFTLQELVDRSRTSLRTFYQHFSSKDDLLLALLEESIARSVADWRARVAGMDALSALQVVVAGISGDRVSTGLSRGMALYHVSLSEVREADYQRALQPLGRLIRDLVQQGAAEGSIRSDVPADRLTRVLIQTVMGAALFNVLGRSGQEVDTEAIWEFCLHGLSPATSGPATSAGTAARRRSGSSRR